MGAAPAAGAAPISAAQPYSHPEGTVPRGEGLSPS